MPGSQDKNFHNGSSIDQHLLEKLSYQCSSENPEGYCLNYAPLPSWNSQYSQELNPGFSIQQSPTISNPQPSGLFSEDFNLNSLPSFSTYQGNNNPGPLLTHPQDFLKQSCFSSLEDFHAPVHSISDTNRGDLLYPGVKADYLDQHSLNICNNPTRSIPIHQPVGFSNAATIDHSFMLSSNSVFSSSNDNHESNAAANNFAKNLSLGTWFSPLCQVGNDQTNDETTHQIVSPVTDNDPYIHPAKEIETCEAQKNQAKPSYSDVLSKCSASGSRIPGNLSSTSKDNSSRFSSQYSKAKQKNTNENKSCFLNESTNIANSSNASYYKSKENCFDKVGLDSFDYPKVDAPKLNDLNNCKNVCPKPKIYYSERSEKNNVRKTDLPNANPNLKKKSKLDKKNSSSGEKSLRTQPIKYSEDQLNNHVPSHQTKQNLGRTSIINNDFTAVSKSDVVDDSHPSKSDASPAVDSEEDYESEDKDSSFSNSGRTNSSYHTDGGGYNRLSTSIRGSHVKDCKKYLQKKKTSLSKRKKQNSPHSTSDMLMAGWSILSVWTGELVKASLWLFMLTTDVLFMSSRLVIHLCKQIFKHGKHYVLHLMAVIHYYWKSMLKQCDSSKSGANDKKLSAGLENNIPFPATGEDAMKRLLACRGKDPYSILGVTRNCSDEDIKKYYKRQAFLVHPDKNKQPGAEEAFKILAHAFEIIGEPERRQQHDTKLAEEVQFEGAWGELASLLSRLKEKIEEAANTIRCTNCNRRHRRVKVPRPVYAARHCAECKIKHAAREGDIWAESWFLGLKRRHFACMEGAIYDISEWAACQRDNLKHLQSNTHSVQYRIVSGKKNANLKNSVPESPSDPELEDFFNNLCRERFKSGQASSNLRTNDLKKRKNKKKK